MDERTLIALKASIEKWERNATVSNIDEVKINRKDCPLCDLYNNDDLFNDNDFLKICSGCPIAEKTKSQYCNNTPYGKTLYEYDRWSYFLHDSLNENDQAKVALSEKLFIELFREAALEEVEFLKSLLPNDSQI